MKPREFFIKTIESWGLAFYEGPGRLYHKASGVLIPWRHSDDWEKWVAQKCGVSLPDPEASELVVVAAALREISVQLLGMASRGEIRALELELPTDQRP